MFNVSFFKDSLLVASKRLLLVLVMGLSLVACGGGEGEGESGPASDSASADTGSSTDDGDDSAPVVADLVISSHPEAVGVTEGEQATFAVTATGEGQLAYEWRKNGSVISGATESTLTIAVAGLADAGAYDVVVTDENGSVTSLSALLTVDEVVVVPVSRTIQLAWDIPTERTDDSSLELYEIEGYIVAYGSESGSLDSFVAVDSASESSVQIEDLVADTYYFAIATVDSEGNQSEFSSEIELEVM